MARGGDEVETGVDACVMVAVEGALDLELLLEVGLKLGIDELHDGLVAADNTKSDRVRLKSVYSGSMKSFLSVCFIWHHLSGMINLLVSKYSLCTVSSS